VSNVLEFKKKNDSLHTTDEEATNKILEVRKNYVNVVVSEITDRIVNDFVNYGFKVNVEGSHLKDLVMISEVMNAALYRYIGVPHFLQEVIDTIVDLEAENGIAQKIINSVNDDDEE